MIWDILWWQIVFDELVERLGVDSFDLGFCLAYSFSLHCHGEGLEKQLSMLFTDHESLDAYIHGSRVT